MPGDLFDDPIFIDGLIGSTYLDMSAFTLDSGEDVLAGVTKTSWLLYTVPTDILGRSLSFACSNPDATVRVYDSSIDPGYAAPYTFDLSRAEFPSDFGQFDGTYIKASAANPSSWTDYVFSDFVLDPTESYTFEFDFETYDNSTGQFPQIQIYSQLATGTAQEAWDDSFWRTLGDSGSHASDGAAATLTVTIGPGINNWNLAMTNGETRMLFEFRPTMRLKAMRLTDGNAVGATPGGGGPPVPLVEIDGGSPAWTLDAPVAGDPYYIQIGTRPGDDQTAVVQWEVAEPSPSASPDTPAVINGEYGQDEAQGSESWVSWTATEDTTVIFRIQGIPGTQPYDVDVFEGDTTTQVNTASGTGATTVEVPVTNGTTYWLRFSSSTSMTWSFSYTTLPVVVDPADDYDGLVVEVYEKDGVTLITELYRRFGSNGQEPLNEIGAGGVSVLVDDEIFDAYPDLFDWQHIVKFWLGNKCIHAFRIKRKTTNYVSTDEWAGWVRTVSGPSAQHLLTDFIVRHDGLMTDKSMETRNFGWMAMNGEWHDPSVWNGPYNTNPQNDPPTNTNDLPKDRPKWHNPPQWPDTTSDWMWISFNPDNNEGGFDPPALEGKRYFRKQFVVDARCKARLYATADEVYRVYLDGELILEGDGKETGYEEMQHVKVLLRAGVHEIAVLNRSRGNGSNGDGADAFMCSLMKLNLKGKPTSVIVNSGPGWNTTYQRPVPTWNRAYVLRAVVREAKNRGNYSANMTTFDFTGEVDSSGKPWIDRFNEEIQIGTDGQAVQSLLSEGGGFDVWVNPEDFRIQAWRRRGKDVSSSVSLEAGRNISDWSVDEYEDAKNDYLIHYDGGWTRYVAHGSQDTYGEREAFVSLGHAKNNEDAERVIKKATDGIAWAQSRAGTNDLRKRKEIDPAGGIIAVPGARPFLDFGVGDTIMAPNKQGILTPHRVLMLTLTEDSEGRLSYDPETEEIV